MNESFQNLEDYLVGGLTKESLLQCPLAQLNLWLAQAHDRGVPDAGVMILATCSSDGRPDQRAILVKQIDSAGLIFFADYASKKAMDMAANPQVCAHFYWHGLDRQIRIWGTAKKISAAETTQVFISRPELPEAPGEFPRNRQSLSSREFLMQQFKAMRTRFYDGGRQPAKWGGYRIVPEHMEFWQGGGPRMRDRYEYKRQEDGSWLLERYNG